MRKNSIRFIGVAVLIVLLSGWGHTGHYKISERIGESLGNKIDGFGPWIKFIADHSSDPDYRKALDKSEGPKHYIDIDHYPEFQKTGKINSSLDTLIARYGKSFVDEQGTLPWATLTAFDSLRYYFKQHDWHRARWWAANLSHYVGDGHMPLHITSNYNGQDTGNKGIHSRYESNMISAYSKEITGHVKPAEYIGNTDSLIFGYLYKSTLLCDSIFNADNRARQVANDTKSDAYLAALWKNTGQMTIEQFNEASYALSSLIYTAWVQAGSPDLSKSNTPEANKPYDCEINSVILNPNDSLLTINFHIYKTGTYKIEIHDSEGMPAQKAGYWEKEPGDYSSTANINELKPGTYLVVLGCARYASTRTIVKE